MNGVRNSGFAKSKIEDLKTGSFTTVNSEDIGNIVHYYRKCGIDAPTPVFIYASKTITTEDNEKTRFFLKATNMPHTKEIYMAKLTPYSLKKKQVNSTEASIDARGYGAILPFLYTGGNFTIQYKNNDTGRWEQITTNIEQWKEDAREDKTDSDLTKPVFQDKFLPGNIKYWEAEMIWGSELIQTFKDLNIQTCEVSIDPTFNGNEDLVGNKEHFENFLEGIQTQFEELFMEKKILVKGYFFDNSTSSTWNLPHNFIKKALPDKEVNDTYLSCFGINNLENKFKLTFYDAEEASHGKDSPLYWRYQKEDSSFVFGKFEYKGYVQASTLSSVTNFDDDFTVTYGCIDETTNLYCKYLTTLDKSKKHPMATNSIEDFANGCLVNINGFRSTLLPIHHSLGKVANQPDKSKARILVNILSDEIKQKCFHSQDWKDKSMFQKGGNVLRSNKIIFAVECILWLAGKLKEKGDRTEQSILGFLNQKAETNQKTRTASLNGNVKEIRINELLRENFMNADIIVGDSTIKKEILEKKQNEPGFQAVDTLLRFEEESIWCALQIKTGERDKPESYSDFIQTFKALRDKALANGCRAFGILVHYNKLKSSPCTKLLANSMGVFLIDREAKEENGSFEKRVIISIQEILKYY